MFRVAIQRLTNMLMRSLRRNVGSCTSIGKSRPTHSEYLPAVIYSLSGQLQQFDSPTQLIFFRNRRFRFYELDSLTLCGQRWVDSVLGFWQTKGCR